MLHIPLVIWLALVLIVEAVVGVLTHVTAAGWRSAVLLFVCEVALLVGGLRRRVRLEIIVLALSGLEASLRLVILAVGVTIVAVVGKLRGSTLVMVTVLIARLSVEARLADGRPYLLLVLCLLL